MSGVSSKIFENIWLKVDQIFSYKTNCIVLVNVQFAYYH